MWNARLLLLEFNCSVIPKLCYLFVIFNYLLKSRFFEQNTNHFPDNTFVLIVKIEDCFWSEFCYIVLNG